MSYNKFNLFKTKKKNEYTVFEGEVVKKEEVVKAAEIVGQGVKPEGEAQEFDKTAAIIGSLAASNYLNATRWKKYDTKGLPGAENVNADPETLKVVEKKKGWSPFK